MGGGVGILGYRVGYWVAIGWGIGYRVGWGIPYNPYDPCRGYHVVPLMAGQALFHGSVLFLFVTCRYFCMIFLFIVIMFHLCMFF